MDNKVLIFIGIAVVGSLLLWSVLKTKSVAELAPYTSQVARKKSIGQSVETKKVYKNAERWHIVRDSRGRLSEIVIEREMAIG